MAEWNAEQYLKFKAERTQPAIDLADRAAELMERPTSILDIGCGPGNSTHVLESRFPHAQIMGMDMSGNMIAKAQKTYPHLAFVQKDIELFLREEGSRSEKNFDLFFSNACLQWLPDHAGLLARLMDALQPGGILAVQIPLQHENPVHHVIQEVASLPVWRDKWHAVRPLYNLLPEEYANVLADCAADYRMWKTTYFHRLPSVESLLEWYRGTGLRPYLEQLDEDEQALFEQDILVRLEKIYLPQDNGEILFPFPRLFFVASARKQPEVL